MSQNGTTYAVGANNGFRAAGGERQDAGSALLADIGSLSLEFTRLSQLTKDSKYFDAIQRITDHFVAQQNSTMLPGMFPVNVNPGAASFTLDYTFSLGAMADSMYEYLPKVGPYHLLRIPLEARTDAL